MNNSQSAVWQETSTDVVAGVALPLMNLEFMIEQYLLTNGQRLDVETRYMLAGVRDCISQVANSTTRLTAAQD